MPENKLRKSAMAEGRCAFLHNGCRKIWKSFFYFLYLFLFIYLFIYLFVYFFEMCVSLRSSMRSFGIVEGVSLPIYLSRIYMHVYIYKCIRIYIYIYIYNMIYIYICIYISWKPFNPFYKMLCRHSWYYSDVYNTNLQFLGYFVGMLYYSWELFNVFLLTFWPS